MVTTPTRTLVQGVPVGLVPYGLFSVLAFRPWDSAKNWEFNGVTWELGAEQVNPANRVIGPVGSNTPDDENPTDRSGLPKNLESTFEQGEAEPFTVYGSAKSTPTAWNADRMQARAIDALRRIEQGAVESEFWNGAHGAVPNLSNPAPVDMGSFATSELHIGIAQLETGIVALYNGGVLHMNRQYASLLLTKGAIRRNSGRLETELGVPVVAGTGYPPGEIIASPPLFGYRSEIFTSSKRPYDLLDTEDNNLYAVAERTYLIGYDPGTKLKITIDDTP